MPNELTDTPATFDTLRDYSPGRTRTGDYATSNTGAQDVSYRAGSQKALLISAYANAYATGYGPLTDEQAAEWAVLPARACFWKRCGELRADGLIAYTGDQTVGSLGSACQQSEITPAGLEYAAEQESQS